MKPGTVGPIPYAAPRSAKLFEAFGSRIERSNGWLLANHGPVVPGRTMLDAFYAPRSQSKPFKIKAWVHFYEKPAAGDFSPAAGFCTLNAA